MSGVPITPKSIEVLRRELEVAKAALKLAAAEAAEAEQGAGAPTRTPAGTPTGTSAWGTNAPLTTSPPISGGVSAAEQDVTYPTPELPPSSLDDGASWGDDATNKDWKTVTSTKKITPGNSSSGESQRELSPEVIGLVRKAIQKISTHNKNDPRTCKSLCWHGENCHATPGTCCAAHDIVITTADGELLEIQAVQVAEIARGYRRTQTVPRNFKSKMCRSIQAGGICPFGKKCLYAHSDDEIRTPHTVTAKERVAAQDEHKRATTTLCTEADCNHDECEKAHSSTLVTYPGQ